ncbi:hypothetical protein [Dehalogenimonas formicexedens]|uniref:hypothetical protein n=1 Tax=Dehalogenimonas formicexedens TaxID=1839801 RepID=UPI00131445C0|nr:hypothetical protein [Dehalogenimonas formicexedens]
MEAVVAGAVVVGGRVVVVGGRVVVFNGVKVWVGSEFMAWLTPKIKLMTAAATTGAVIKMLLLSDASAIFRPPKH